MKTRACFRLLAILLLFLIPWAASPSEKSGANGELTSYQGVLLGSVNDFRENSIKGVQKVDIKKYRLQVDGLVNQPLSFTYDQLRSFPHRKKLVPLHCVEGWTVNVLWEGIPFSEFAGRAGVLPGADTVIFHAADGYTTSQDLKAVAGKNMLLADSANGLVLPAHLGFPFILVADDKWGYKWARWIVRIEFSAKKGYRGYWEVRGYNNRGDLTGPEFERQ